eukprot:jgi/Psemu1/313814/fgenesh1_kg.1312_\
MRWIVGTIAASPATLFHLLETGGVFMPPLWQTSAMRGKQKVTRTHTHREGGEGGRFGISPNGKVECRLNTVGE